MEIKRVADSSATSYSTLGKSLISVRHNCSFPKEIGQIKISQVLPGFEISWFCDSDHLGASFILHVAT